LEAFILGHFEKMVCKDKQAGITQSDDSTCFTSDIQIVKNIILQHVVIFIAIYSLCS
jgi:hypothetical protein